LRTLPTPRSPRASVVKTTGNSVGTPPLHSHSFSLFLSLPISLAVRHTQGLSYMTAAEP
jgi:hypothetical protein